MRLIHHLATKSNDLPLSSPDYSTLHEIRAGHVTHTGWAIAAQYDGDAKNKMKHKYELVFSPEEAFGFLKELLEMLPRFEEAGLPTHEITADSLEKFYAWSDKGEEGDT